MIDKSPPTVKSHRQDYINEGHNMKSASDMKAAVDLYGGVKRCQAEVVKIQKSSQTMKKHKMLGTHALKYFSFES